MTSRRLMPLVLLVAALIALAALAAHGRPIGHSHGTGPTPVFFDYVVTTLALVAAAIAIVFLWSLTGAKWSKPTRRRYSVSLAQLIASLVMSIVVGFLLLHAHFKQSEPNQVSGVPTRPHHAGRPQPPAAANRTAHLRWDEVAIVLGLLAAIGVATFAMRTSRPIRRLSLRPHEEVALALDESLDDLRAEPDIRRAIIAAYARMERALGAAGLPRRPAEAPFEYLSRALRSLDASAGAVTRLTDLFERAKFSDHVLDESMRAEAIDALVDVRDELRAPVGAAA